MLVMFCSVSYNLGTILAGGGFMSFAIEEWDSILKSWHLPQVAMSKVIRWGNHLENDVSNSLRIQNTLQHTHSLVFMCDVLSYKLQSYVELDEALLLRACHYHDVGEGLCGFDTPYGSKSDNQDLNEYLAFCEFHKDLDEKFFLKQKQAFLLQFAGKDKYFDLFPPDALYPMLTLKKYKPYEVLFFEVLERWEYFFYPLEHCSDGKHMDLLRSVVKNQCPRLDELAEELPGFKEEIWTDSISAKLKSLL